MAELSTNCPKIVKKGFFSLATYIRKWYNAPYANKWGFRLRNAPTAKSLFFDRSR
jgi:hypothetical protein